MVDVHGEHAEEYASDSLKNTPEADGKPDLETTKEGNMALTTDLNGNCTNGLAPEAKEDAAATDPNYLSVGEIPYPNGEATDAYELIVEETVVSIVLVGGRGRGRDDRGSGRGDYNYESGRGRGGRYQRTDNR